MSHRHNACLWFCMAHFHMHISCPRVALSHSQNIALRYCFTHGGNTVEWTQTWCQDLRLKLDLRHLHNHELLEPTALFFALASATHSQVTAG